MTRPPNFEDAFIRQLQAAYPGVAAAVVQALWKLHRSAEALPYPETQTAADDYLRRVRASLADYAAFLAGFQSRYGKLPPLSRKGAYATASPVAPAEGSSVQRSFTAEDCA